MKALTDRVAVVTGAAAGVGLGIAQVLALDGAKVVIADIDPVAAQRAAEDLVAAGSEAIAVPTDVVERASVDAMAVQVVARYGRLDILAANAGIYPSATLDVMTDADIDHVLDINVKGAFHSIQSCLPAMRAGGYGRIVLTSSITGAIVGAPELSHYAASKAALLGLMRSAALELVSDGITVNAVLPGNVRTPGIEQFGQQFIDEMVESIPLKRLAEPTEVGWAVRFLASEEAGYITGQSIVVDGGQVLPEGNL
jgi:3-oxoacyl-[acyl-carrier protein] reductase